MSKVKSIIDKMRKGEDIGLDRSADVGRQQSINDDGSYNMVRLTGKFFGGFNPYHWTITTSWTNYWLVLLLFYGMMNFIFAWAYYLIGNEQFVGVGDDQGFHFFLKCFFFSAQTFTTVGYGGIHPVGITSSIVASLEAFIGLMTFALATGTLYGRFSKPVSKIKYSASIIISPLKEGFGMQLMVANEFSSTLMEMSARVILSWMDSDSKGKPIRKFQEVELEIDKIAMFPTNWVINHIIKEDSALFGKQLDEIKALDFEVFVLLKGFDDVFSQTIYSRHSYTADSFVFGVKFIKPFHINEKGKLVMDLSKVGDYEKVEIQ